MDAELGAKNQVEQPGCLRPGPLLSEHHPSIEHRWGDPGAGADRGGGGPGPPRAGLRDAGRRGGGRLTCAPSRGAPARADSGRLWASLGYFLKRTQDRQESWFLNNFLRARPPPVPQRFLLPLPDSWSQRRSLRLFTPPSCRHSGIASLRPFSPVLLLTSPTYNLPPLPGHWERRALRAGQTAPRPLGQRVGAKGLPTQGDSFALQNFKLGWPGEGVWSQTAVATQHV